MKSVMNVLHELGEIWTQNFDAMNSELLWPKLGSKVLVSKGEREERERTRERENGGGMSDGITQKVRCDVDPHTEHWKAPVNYDKMTEFEMTYVYIKYLNINISHRNSRGEM